MNEVSEEHLEEVTEEILALINDRITVTDQWGGEKIAAWKYGNNLVLEGDEDLAEMIALMFIEEEKKIEELTELVKAEQIWREWHNASTNPPLASGTYEVFMRTCTDAEKRRHKVTYRSFNPKQNEEHNGWFLIFADEVILAWRPSSREPTIEEQIAIGINHESE